MSGFYSKENGSWVERRGNVLYCKNGGKWSESDRSALSEGKYVCEYLPVRYVSLGDSIAAGHMIDNDWKVNYGGENSQYDVNGNTETVIVHNSYTDLIRRELVEIYGEERVSVKSFARSGDTVADLMAKLEHEVVQTAIREATLVTVCIGANDVLEPAMSHLADYINTGDINALKEIVNNNLAVLGSDTEPNSYRKLFDKLQSLNPKATFVFTTIYNPFKYLYIAPSTAAGNYTDGFFGPLLWAIPEWIGSALAGNIRGAFMESNAVRNLLERLNGLSEYAEHFITQLNAVLRDKIAAYGNENFLLADAKATFDPVPDRPVSAPKHYNDLVRVQFTRDYTVNDVDWGKFWKNVDFNAIISGMEQAANEIVNTVINDVIVPDADPHPLGYGHHALRCAFADVLDWEHLPRRGVTYHANGGTGNMAVQTVVSLDGMTAYADLSGNGFAAPAAGYLFVGWNTSADGSGVSYSNGQQIPVSSDVTLYAQWSNLCRVTVYHEKNVRTIFSPTYTGDQNNGPVNQRAVWVDGTNRSGEIGGITATPQTIEVEYGKSFGVVVKTEKGGRRAFVEVDGYQAASEDPEYGAAWQFNINCNLEVRFVWTYELVTENLTDVEHSYWRAYVTTK